MSSRPHLAWLVLLVFVLGGVGAPFLGANVVCTDDGDDVSCEDCCSLCECCLHGPQPVLEAGGDERLAVVPVGLAALEVQQPMSPLPREILHVPKFFPTR